MCAGYILFCLIGAGNFYECCRGTETLSQGSPEARSQKITKGNPIFFPQGMFYYSLRFVEELKSLRDHKGIYNKNNKKQAGCWLKSRWVQDWVDILRIELYSNFG